MKDKENGNDRIDGTLLPTIGYIDTFIPVDVANDYHTNNRFCGYEDEPWPSIRQTQPNRAEHLPCEERCSTEEFRMCTL